MLKHKVCGNKIDIIVIKSFCAVGYSVSKSGVKVGMFKDCENDKKEIICPKCGKVDLSEIDGYCINCRESFSINDLFVTNLGPCCKDCCKNSDLQTVRQILEKEVL